MFACNYFSFKMVVFSCKSWSDIFKKYSVNMISQFDDKSMWFYGTWLDVEGLRCLSLEWKLFTCRNFNREQLRKIHQL